MVVDISVDVEALTCGEEIVEFHVTRYSIVDIEKRDWLDAKQDEQSHGETYNQHEQGSWAAK